MRGTGAAAASSPPRPPAGSVAATPAVGSATRRGKPVRVLPDNPGDGARVRAGRVRRAGSERPDARDRVSQSAPRRGRDAGAVPVRPPPDVRLRRAVPVRGRLASGAVSYTHLTLP